MITRKTVRDKIFGYLNHEITLAQLVDWAENALNEGTLDSRDTSLLADGKRFLKIRVTPALAGGARVRG